MFDPEARRAGKFLLVCSPGRVNIHVACVNKKQKYSLEQNIK